MGWLHKALVGVSVGREPHIATTNKVFTAIYGGASVPISEFDGRVYFDCVILDMSDRETQIMYKGKYVAGGEVSPPLCFSDNGIGPSLGAPQPQAATCAGCQWRQFGTAINESGKGIPRCTKKKRIVVLPLKLGYDTPLQFDLPPAALKNWGGFIQQIKDARVDEMNVLVRVYMIENDKGFLDFTILGYVDQLIGPQALAVIQYRAAQPDISSLARSGDQPIDPLSWRPELAGVVEPLTALPSPQMVNAFVNPQTAVTYTPTHGASASPFQQVAQLAPPPQGSPMTYAPPPASPPAYAPPAYAPPPALQAPAPAQGQPIEPDAPPAKKKPGRPRKEAPPAASAPPSTHGPAPTAADVMGSYGMAKATPVGAEMSNKIIGALQTPIPDSK